MSVSIEEILAMFRAENALMLDAAIQKMEGAIDARMTGYENRISKEVSIYRSVLNSWSSERKPVRRVTILLCRK